MQGNLAEPAQASCAHCHLPITDRPFRGMHSACYTQHYDQCHDCNIMALATDLQPIGAHYYCAECHEGMHTTCAGCAERILTTDAQPDPNEENWYCEDCWSDRFFTCEGCDEHRSRDEENRGPGECSYCDSCADRFQQCEHPDCDEVCWNEDLVWVESENASICRPCFRSYYFRCGTCSSVFLDDHNDGNGYCPDCNQDHEDDTACDCGDCACGDCNPRTYSRYSSVIRSYGDKTASHRLGTFGTAKDGLRFGVELETCVTSDANRDEVARHVLMTMGADFVVLKEDSSLSRGFEIVSAPATMDVHRERWTRLLATSRHDALRSWDSPNQCCGMHVHASRKALSSLTVGKLCAFLSESGNHDFLDQLAGRSPNHYCERQQGTVTDAHPKKPQWGYRRTVALNLNNEQTIEFRLFRGTLKLASFLKNLDFVRALIDWARQASHKETNYRALVVFVASRRKDYPDLAAFLVERSYLPAPKPRPVSLVPASPILTSDGAN